MDFSRLLHEVKYRAVRSSGSGGQHVNKVATKMELYFNIQTSSFFSYEEKERLKVALSSRLNRNGVLILSCSETRSQLKNKTIVTRRFIQLVTEGLKEEKERVPTKIPRAVKQKRLNNKRRNSEKKANRKKPNID
ncbi:MAG: aminoacyl-tRNA hydrolase [Winogradskyella sp.]|uniref:alternative ribosome rescue aminoacyl-tRNA hydrolase ArfB n=1 Tax=Winogradskyella sp. TaxID=1883156 RepID=UPI000F3F9AE0|nr:alternative ribosome rescue aminoacyl-tRNA hydrolase ArfB [Winogradskyella sp.]RNC87816.1 MAG: aminoacyl-tRNA hydrolase [Winogradskyella sp.]